MRGELSCPLWGCSPTSGFSGRARARAAEPRVSRMSDHVDRARRYHDGIRRILLNDWDPIGVADIAEAQDEYDSYVGKIYGMLTP